jgi:cytoskeletal protein RodZ
MADYGAVDSLSPSADVVAQEPEAAADDLDSAAPAPWYHNRVLLALWAAIVALLVALISYGLIQISHVGGGGAPSTSTPSTTPSRSSTTSPTTTTTTPSTTTETPATTPEEAPPSGGNSPGPTAPTEPPRHRHHLHLPHLPHGF